MSARILRLILLVCLVAGPVRGQVPVSKHLEITGSHTLRITYEFNFTWPKGGGYTAVFHLPIPPETGSQHITHFSSSLKGLKETYDNESPPHRLLTATLHHKNGEPRQVQWRVVIEGDFRTRQLKENAGGIFDPPPLVPLKPGEFLSETESLNWKSDVFQQWLESAGLRRGKDEAAMTYAERLYTYLKTNGRYHYPPGSAWSAAAVCHHLGTDCGGFSTVFTAACRANRIPARMLVGQWFKSRLRPDGTVELAEGRQSHVIAEFHDPVWGWIPEDISSTLLETPGYPDLNFFGRDPGYFFTWHFDNDFHFDLPRKTNAHVQWIQNPNLWFSENADAANDSATHHWTVETLK